MGAEGRTEKADGRSFVLRTDQWAGSSAAEQQTLNLRVVGSIPTRLTTYYAH